MTAADKCFRELYRQAPDLYRYLLDNNGRIHPAKVHAALYEYGIAREYQGAGSMLLNCQLLLQHILNARSSSSEGNVGQKRKRISA